MQGLATQFSSTYQPARNGRTRTSWLSAKLNAATGPDGQTVKEKIAAHLIEIATSWEVKVIGRDSDGEVLKVASGRDAVEAAKVLFGYEMGLPHRPESKLEIANHLLAVAKLQVDLALGMLGNRVNAMNLDELKAFFAKCSENPAAFLEAAKAMQTQEVAPTQPAMPESTPDSDKAAP